MRKVGGGGTEEVLVGVKAKVGAKVEAKMSKVALVTVVVMVAAVAGVEGLLV